MYRPTIHQRAFPAKVGMAPRTATWLACVLCSVALVSRAAAEGLPAEGSEPTTQEAPAQDAVEHERTPPGSLPVKPVETDKGTPAAVTPEMKSLAVMQFRCPEQELVAPVTAQAAQALRELGVFSVIDPDSVAGMLQAESMRQVTGCTERSCLAEIAGALGAEYILTGTVSAVDQGFQVNVVLVKQHSAQNAGGALRYATSRTQLLAATRSAAVAAVSQLLSEYQGTLYVVASELEADVKLDDVLVATTPMQPRRVGIGPHRLSIQKPGFVAFSQDILVQQDQNTVIKADLIPNQQYIQSYKLKNRLLRLGAATSALGTMAGLGGGALLYASWMVIYVAGYRAGPTAAVADVLDPNPRNLMNQPDELSNFYLGVVLNLLFIGAVVTPLLGLVSAPVGVVLWLLGDDPSRYDQYAS